jgi:hypothetical protein
MLQEILEPVWIRISLQQFPIRKLEECLMLVARRTGAKDKIQHQCFQVIIEASCTRK